MRPRSIFNRLTVTDESDDAQASCRYCDQPIRHYPHIGWIDVTPAVKAGTYDMCPVNDQTAEHLPGLSAGAPAVSMATTSGLGLDVS